eukprot:XP_002320216.3 uncharacterized protein LOC7492797 [Populus trichocarpa]
MENFGVSPVTVNFCYLSLSSLSYFNTLNYFDGREILKRREVNEVRNGKQRRKESQWLNLASKVEDEYIDSYATVTSSVPNSPATKAVTTSAARVPGPTPSLRIIKPTVQTPPQSPKPKPTAPPPSPLTRPPSRVKSDADLEPKIPLVAEQKTVLVQKIIDKPKEAGDSLRAFADSLSSGIARLAKPETAKDQTKEKGSGKKISSDSEDVGMRVITIAGENKGAFMEVIRSPKKHFFEGNSHTLNKKGNPRSEGSDWGSQSSSGEEGNSKKDKNHKGRSMGPSPMSAFMNSNVQGVNNSIVYNSSCSHHDPGVHVALSRKPSGSAGFHVKDRGNGYQS